MMRYQTIYTPRDILRVPHDQEEVEGQQLIKGIDTKRCETLIRKYSRDPLDADDMENIKRGLTTILNASSKMCNILNDRKNRKKYFSDAGADYEIPWEIRGQRYSDLEYIIEFSKRFMSIISLLELVFKTFRVPKQTYRWIYSHENYEDATRHLYSILERMFFLRGRKYVDSINSLCRLLFSKTSLITRHCE